MNPDDTDNRPESEINAETNRTIEVAFERVKKARKELIEKRTGRKYSQQQPERNWSKPYVED